MTGTPRTTATCLHQHAQHHHGTRTCYVLDRCRCTPCRAANAAYETHRNRLTAYGRATTDQTDAGPVLAHIEHLRAAGMGYERIAAAANVSPTTVFALITGTRQRVTQPVADRLVAVTLDLAPGALVPAAGTRRRLQALVAVGWSYAALGRHAGHVTTTMHGLTTSTAPQVEQATASRIRALYDELWDIDGGDTRARRRAARNGWPPPMAWDDDALDDPDAAASTSPGGCTVDGCPERLFADGLCNRHYQRRRRHGNPTAGRSASSSTLEDARWLLDQGCSLPEAASRLGVTVNAIEQAMTRARRASA